MRRLKKTVHCALVAWGFGLISGWAQADVFVMGTLEGRPGDMIELSIVAGPGTALDFIDIATSYADFDKVLTLIGFHLGPALSDGAGELLCSDDLCTAFFLPSRVFDQEAILATWQFQVTANAEDFVDTKGDRTFPFDLGISLGPAEGPLPDGQVFTVLAVPEPSSWSLTALGVLLLVGARRRPWRYSLRGPAVGIACGECPPESSRGAAIFDCVRRMVGPTFRVAQAQRYRRR